MEKLVLSGIKNDLLEAGKDEGCITFQHLNELLPEQIRDPGAIEELFDFLGENNIEIVTMEESGKRKTLSGEEWTGKKADEDETLPDALPDNEEHEPEETTTTYLREMGQFDLLTPEEVAAKQSLLDKVQAEKITISAKFKNNTDRLQTKLVEAANLPEVGQNDVIVTNIRHYEALTRALEAIQRVISGMDNGISSDFLAQDIRECMHYLGEITGQISNDEILGNIFAKFCIGK